MERIVAEFRHALDKVDWATMPGSFRDFPVGTCGDISDIFAEHLYAVGYSDIEYVCGEDQNVSHAWLEIEGIAIDLTASQFEEVDQLFLIQKPQIWHSRFEVVNRRKAGYKNMRGPAISGLIQVHNEILKKLNA